MPVLFSGPFCGQLFYNIISPSVCYEVAHVSALIISFTCCSLDFTQKALTKPEPASIIIKWCYFYFILAPSCRDLFFILFGGGGDGVHK